MDLDILSKEIGSDKIVLAGHFPSQEMFNDFSSGFQSKFAHVLIGEFKLVENSSGNPVIFVIDKSLNIKLFYSPDIYPDIQDIYYKKILKTYFSRD